MRANWSVLFVLLCLVSIPASAASKTEKRLAKAATVTSEILGMPEGLPQDLLDKAECVLVFPGVKKIALGVGGSFGAGVLMCRGGDNFTGAWGSPAMMRLEGGNIGFQIGGQSTDFLLLVMNKKGTDSVMRSNMKLGADAAAVAGPKGRSAGAATDAYMNAEILTYSRSKGLFAGISLEGSSLRADDKSHRELYGKEIKLPEILTGNLPFPGAASGLRDILAKASPKNLSE